MGEIIFRSTGENIERLHYKFDGDWTYHDFVKDMVAEIQKQHKHDGDTRTPLPIRFRELIYKRVLLSLLQIIFTADKGAHINRILRLLPDAAFSLSTLLLPNTNPTSSITNFPPDDIVLRTANAAFNEAPSNTSFTTPLQKNAPRLNEMTEHLHSILRCKNMDHAKGGNDWKTTHFEGQIIDSTEEVQQKLVKTEGKEEQEAQNEAT